MHSSFRTRGFTLVELIVVIVITGTLAAVVIPRYIDLGGAARTATAQRFHAELVHAVNLVHFRAVLENKGELAASGVLTDDGHFVNITYGWPDNDEMAIGPEWGGTDVIGLPESFATGGGGTLPAEIMIDGVAGCVVTYDEPDAAGESASITLDTSGC